MGLGRLSCKSIPDTAAIAHQIPRFREPTEDRDLVPQVHKPAGQVITLALYALCILGGSGSGPWGPRGAFYKASHNLYL